ncbi:MAG: hypothetical protein ACOYXS_01945, partial [Chloroflexota bacterium]
MNHAIDMNHAIELNHALDRPASPPMEYANSILELIGRTPLVRLSRVTADLGPAERQPLILAKLEL